MPRSLLDLTRPEIAALLEELGAPVYRVDQLLHGIYRQSIRRVGELSTFPRDLRELLDSRLPVGRLRPVAHASDRDGTRKILLELRDGMRVEAVAIPAGDRLTACLSTQVGCALGCRFCATAQMGFLRNLRAGEMVAQFLALHETRDEGPVPPITNAVFMGMGEPLANYAETVRAAHLLNAPEGVGLRKRGIRISTAGLVPQIQRLARDMPQVGLTISLNASRDSLRDRIMPINRTYPLARLVTAADRFSQTTGRMVTFAYVLIPGVNDSLREGRELVALLAGRQCKLNLIPFNSHPVLPSLARWAEAEPVLPPLPAPRGRHPLVEYLTERFLHATFRRSRGASIRAACGQLFWSVRRSDGQAARP